MKLNPVYIASTIIGISIAGFLLISWMLGHTEFTPETEKLLIVLRHGCEGALVGGICDFIAVKSVYTAAREHFPSLRDNTTRIVVQDMIQVRKQVEDISNLEELLHNAQHQARFISAVEQFAPSKENLDQLLRGLWNEQLRPHIASWMINYKFEGTAQQFTTRHEINTDLFRQGAVELLRDVANQEKDNTQLVEKLRRLASDVTLHDVGVPSEPTAVRHLLEKLYSHWTSLEPDADVTEKPFFARMGHTLITQCIVGFSPAIAEKVKTINLEDTFSPLLTEETLKDTLLALAEKIEHPNTVESLADNHDLLADIVSYWLVFVRAWEDLAPALRTDIVEEIIRIVETPALELLTNQIWDLRMQLLTPEKLLEQEGTKALLTTLGDTLKEQAESIEQTSVQLLQQQFDDMGQDGFVDMLQRNTKARLDWIKVNGSAWGFALGSVVGIVGLFLAH
jgi:hypothetical protein